MPYSPGFLLILATTVGYGGFVYLRENPKNEGVHFKENENDEATVLGL